MRTLQPNATLQGGKYIIKKVLGQGGFGITYLAENTMLEGKVAIKEFFFKEYCSRDEATSYVTIGTSGNRELVERFKQKFIKEARTIFKLNHPNIVRILDIFEENGTAYYVMDYIEGESLGDMLKRRGAVPEAEAVGYIKEVSSALSYIHGKSINHLDIKPNNIMKRQEDGKILLIDFGVSKQYDAETAEGTTTTPVGISHGYSPVEQYKKNGVSSFSPQSDIYSLGATLYKLVTGVKPPEAIEVAQGGLPPMGSTISENVKQVILDSMQFQKENRPQTIAAFVEILDRSANAVSIVVHTPVNIVEEDETTQLVEINDELCLQFNRYIMKNKKGRRDKIDESLLSSVCILSLVISIIVVPTFFFYMYWDKWEHLTLIITSICMIFVLFLFLYNGLLRPVFYILPMYFVNKKYNDYIWSCYFRYCERNKLSQCDKDIVLHYAWGLMVNP